MKSAALSLGNIVVVIEKQFGSFEQLLKLNCVGRTRRKVLATNPVFLFYLLVNWLIVLVHLPIDSSVLKERKTVEKEEYTVPLSPGNWLPQNLPILEKSV